MSDRTMTNRVSEDERGIEAALRPQSLQDYVGQSRMKDALAVCIEAAKRRGEALDHAIFYGPPGLGKTTIAHIIAREMGSAIRSTSGLVLNHAGDLAAILTNLQEGDVLFIDEIHRLRPPWKRPSTPRWKTTSSIWLSGRVHRRERSSWTCPGLRWSGPPRARAP